MTTELKRFTEAYPTMTVAAYEPLILRWISRIGIRFISNSVAYRLPKAAAIKFDGKTPSALALNKTLRKPLPAGRAVSPSTSPENIIERLRHVSPLGRNVAAESRRAIPRSRHSRVSKREPAL
jgi:hypothetical protein